MISHWLSDWKIAIVLCTLIQNSFDNGSDKNFMSCKINNKEWHIKNITNLFALLSIHNSSLRLSWVNFLQCLKYLMGIFSSFTSRSIFIFGLLLLNFWAMWIVVEDEILWIFLSRAVFEFIWDWILSYFKNGLQNLSLYIFN